MLAYPQQGFGNLLSDMFRRPEGIIGWRFVTPITPEGDDVYAICERCTEVMEMHRPGRLECLSCGLFHEVGE
jgi:hypothetical protein